ITGAASGIGYAQAKVFLKNGAYVCGYDLNEAGLQELSHKYPNKFTYYIGNVSQKESINQAVKNIINKFGKIDILLNTAGVLDDYKLTTTKDKDILYQDKNK